MIHDYKGGLKDHLAFTYAFTYAALEIRELVNWKICGFAFWCHEQVK